MNARGKPLTEFENFKAEFEKYIEDDEIKSKLDNDWLDIFWNKYKDNLKDIVFDSDLVDEFVKNEQRNLFYSTKNAINEIIIIHIKYIKSK